MSAIISACGLFRYRLEREVQADGIVVALIDVNPSTADATVDDATIRKDIGFGRRNGWRRIIKADAFAFRSTDVRALADARDPIGPENDTHLRAIMADADVIVPCWGNSEKVPKRLRPRFAAITRMVADSGKPVLIFGLTKGADPLHPFMLGYDTKLRPWQTIERMRAPTGRLTPHQKIMAAARRMRGVRLTPDEVTKLASDNAIQNAAKSDEEQAAERDACRAATGDSSHV